MMKAEGGIIEAAAGLRTFAASFGLPKRTIQDWEQGRRYSEGATRLLLKLIEREPEAVKRALRVD